MLTFFYTLRSPYARKVRILLSELGVPHTPVEIDPGNVKDGTLFGEDYELQIPSMRVPSIQDGDQIIFESNAIVAYLLQKYPLAEPGVAQPPLATSMVRNDDHQWRDTMVLTTIETMLNSAINITFMKRSGVDIDDVSYLRRERERCHSCLDWLEAHATPDGFIPGVFSIADLNLVCALQWFDDRDVLDWWGRRKLETIVARYQKRPSVTNNPLVFKGG